jgi:adenine-specific DNA-methyltransferase
MAKTKGKKGKKTGEVTTADYRHVGEKRPNIPPAAIAAEGTVPPISTVRYQYSPHLAPELRFDVAGRADALPPLIAEAGTRPLVLKEQQQLAEALNGHQPWLEWAGKRERSGRGFFEVDPVALHIHERVSTQAMLRALAREDVQRDLFADPQQPYAQAIQFYKHQVDWANRLILGDSLQVMTSLARREQLAGKVQMIYMDPPYGIRFGSNFQPTLSQRDVKERDVDLTREPEMVKAYRDTWTLGVHSYLSYLSVRLVTAKELLSDTGSIFVQIGDENVHRVRLLLDETFGTQNFVSLVTVKKTTGGTGRYLPGSADYLLWYAKDIERLKYRELLDLKELGAEGATGYTRVELLTGERRPITPEELTDPSRLPPGARIFAAGDLSSQSQGRQKGEGAASWFPVTFRGVEYRPNSQRRWSTNEDGMQRLLKANRVHAASGDNLSYVRMFDDVQGAPMNNVWTDTVGQNQYGGPKLFVVQTINKVLERCLLMTTDAGDLVLDPTCGSGTTAYVAEQWGRRWITCDSSRIAIALARQRLMTARLPYYELRPITPQDEVRNPHGAWLIDGTGGTATKRTFRCKTVPYVTLRSIAQNPALDPIFQKHDQILSALHQELNSALGQVPSELRPKLLGKLAAKRKLEGSRSISDADSRRWSLPASEWRDWEIPFDTDPDWPSRLSDALTAYRTAWRARMEDVQACISANADVVEVVDKPEVVPTIVRVAGPFTTEGVRPEELSLGDGRLFGPTPNGFEAQEATSAGPNVRSYLTQMLQHLKQDGVTFLGNQRKTFARLEGLFEATSGSLIHAEGAWDGAAEIELNAVAISVGPQHGPVTALQVEEAIRAAKRYEELVIAGFSFDAEAYAVVETQGHPKLRIHLAQIRPDLNEAMAGLLKDTPDSQLFTVFGQPEIEIEEGMDGWVCTLNGVDIYNPVENTVRSSGADKVAAWFLDSDFDGRCFCITQAFFPDQSAWDKIAKTLGSSANPEAFAALKGTVSLPFPKGKFARIAVKVIDPRGNEVMAVRQLA